jgi:DNA-binding NarL/FixJ family response regulator
LAKRKSINHHLSTINRSPLRALDPELDELTMPEREMLRLIARGYLYKEIALQLNISAKTVEAHVSAVLRKPSSPTVTS